MAGKVADALWPRARLKKLPRAIRPPQNIYLSKKTVKYQRPESLKKTFGAFVLNQLGFNQPFEGFDAVAEEFYFGVV